MLFFKNYRKLHLALLVVWDILSVYLAIIIGFKLRFGLVGSLPRLYADNMVFYVLIMTLVAIMSNVILRCYNSIWRYFGYKDFLKQIAATLLTSLFVVLIDSFIGLEMPFEMFILIPSFMAVFMLAGRFSPRFVKAVKSRYYKRKQVKKIELSCAIIYGAGEAGRHLISNINEDNNSQIKIVGFIDDDPNLLGLKIGGIPVIGGSDSLEFAINDLKVKEVVIAIPTADSEFVKSILSRCKKLNVTVKRYGSMSDVTVEDFQKATITQINFEELLRRDSVILSVNNVTRFIKGKVVLVTGGVGSIGSEICRQVLKLEAKRLIVFDINENGLFYMKNELDSAGYTGKFEVLLGSVRDRNRLKEVFSEYEPNIVFHAAAHKHVPMMEGNPKEAVKNNVLGTINVANEATFHDVEKFILISTDKAVNPTNIMGASKRIAEIAIQVMNSATNTEFAAVRFGNVLGSNGSVVPSFKAQIEAGGPVTVTHPDMKRYFMTIPEAVQLVLEAGAMATGGEIFVLDMGEPVLIYDLACDLIRIYGLEPDKDIKIEFTGLRPGEKLYEEISLADEDTSKTDNNKIFVCKPTENNPQEFSRNIKRLESIVKTTDITKMFETISKMVPTFNHNNADTTGGGGQSDEK